MAAVGRRPPPLPFAPPLLEAFLLAVFLVLLDLALSRLLPHSQQRWSAEALWRLAALRGFEVLVLLLYFVLRKRGLEPLGFGVSGLPRSLVVWAGGAALLAIIAAIAELYGRQAMDASFLRLVSGPRVESLPALVVAGVFIGPLFEELLFRALVYAPLRRVMGVPFSVVATTLIFVAPHLTDGKGALVPAVGGIFFCLALEYSQSLYAPLLLHMSGNAVLFLLPYILGWAF